MIQIEVAWDRLRDDLSEKQKQQARALAIAVCDETVKAALVHEPAWARTMQQRIGALP